jgi:hypothetical protein
MVMASGRVRKQTDSGERDRAEPVGVRSAAGRSAAILEWAQDVQTCGAMSLDPTLPFRML